MQDWAFKTSLKKHKKIVQIPEFWTVVLAHLRFKTCCFNCTGSNKKLFGSNKSPLFIPDERSKELLRIWTVCKCINHGHPDSQRERSSGCSRWVSAACLLTDPCGSRYSRWRRVISGMRCENTACGTWAPSLCGRATAMKMKAYQLPVQTFNPAGHAESRTGPYRVWMRLLLRSAAAGTHVPCQNTLLLQNEESLVP